MMNNLKNTMLVVILLTTTVFYGQRKPDWEKIKTLKIAFITEQLDLSSNEAEAFWPVYNTHEAKLIEFRKIERSEISAKLNDLDAISDSEADKLLEKYTSLELEKDIEQQSYLKKLKKIISSKKTILLMKTEEDFKRKLIQQYRQKRNGGGGYR